MLFFGIIIAIYFVASLLGIVNPNNLLPSYNNEVYNDEEEITPLVGRERSKSF
jgi:hypothetical protein